MSVMCVRVYVCMHVCVYVCALYRNEILLIAASELLQHFNGRCVTFGRVIEGDKVIKEIEKVRVMSKCCWLTRCTIVSIYKSCINSCGFAL
jgi:cyclophilin family peptidyl-prolyl cis-trans isomerase